MKFLIRCTGYYHDWKYKEFWIIHDKFKLVKDISENARLRSYIYIKHCFSTSRDESHMVTVNKCATCKHSLRLITDRCTTNENFNQL